MSENDNERKALTKRQLEAIATGRLEPKRLWLQKGWKWDK